MSAIVPLISSGVAGPLGVIHLPRLWSKVLLSAKGLLPEDYDECGKGFDQMVLDGLKINREVAVRYIKGHLPTYPQFEKWVLDQKGGRLNKGEVDALNAAIRGYNHADATRASILSAAGVTDDGSIKDAVNLNNIDDWTTFHAAVTGS
ncbi:MAG: DUF5069 domain-containing protein [Candidatus Latescibacteria bacterium]|nr:DUF5069 domain-containing protein [Candidatus Latescibacterota bacterium]